MIINPLSPLIFFKINSLKATVLFLLVLLIKANLLRVKGGILGGFIALLLLSGIVISSSIAAGSLIYAFKIKNKIKVENNFDSSQDMEPINI